MFFWRKKKAKREDDKIWATKELKLRGIGEEISRALAQNDPVLVVGHFEKTMEELKAVLDAKNLRYRVAQTDLDLSHLDQGETRLTLLSSENISGSTSADHPLPGRDDPQGKKIDIVVVEHYPLPERDQAVLSFAQRLPLASTVCFHVSLDEPLLSLFGIESVVGLLKRLGWDETRSVSHPMITAAIASVQKRIKKSAFGDQRVQSMEEWFSYNYPSSR